jgi:hypothetical protein
VYTFPVRATRKRRIFITGNSSVFEYLSCVKQIAAALKISGELRLKIVLYGEPVAREPARVKLLDTMRLHH